MFAEEAENFLLLLQAEAQVYNRVVATESGDWLVKGFIDVFKNVYTISGDTKVVSKLIELLLFPRFVAFAERHHLKLVLSREQNHYPDLTFIDEEGRKFAVDIKSTYRTSETAVNTMTLGAFTGYFRNRTSAKNITFPYQEYTAHLVFGVLYSRAAARVAEGKLYAIDDLAEIPSVVHDLQFFVQPKYRIASDQPGSGNTKNIGAVGTIARLVSGSGPFASLGEAVFDDYWMYYMTADMARAVESPSPPYRNLTTYFAYKNGPPGVPP